MPTFDVTATYARDMLARRAEQDTLFGIPLRGTIAWDILLVLFVADAEGRSFTGRQAVEEAGGSLEVGKRWLAYLVQEGLVIRRGIANLEAIVTIAPSSITKLEGFVQRCLATGRRLG